MIYITCDIHHQSLGTGNQKFSDRTEMQCAYDFFKKIEKYNLKATYFISGKSFLEDWGSELHEISSSSLIEIGGHNWDCFSNEMYHRVCNKLLNSYNGTKSFQERDCYKTQEIIFQKTGKHLSSWRNHMYMHGKYTDQVLREAGIFFCSDGVKSGELSPSVSLGGYQNIPINIIPDHEHIYHAERTPLYVKNWVKRYDWKDDFGSDSYYINEWGNIMLNQVLDNERNGRDSLLIIHPITMYLADKYNFIDLFMNRISELQTSNISEFA